MTEVNLGTEFYSIWMYIPEFNLAVERGIYHSLKYYHFEFVVRRLNLNHE
jgi:hypothetical protein